MSGDAEQVRIEPGDVGNLAEFLSIEALAKVPPTDGRDCDEETFQQRVQQIRAIERRCRGPLHPETKVGLTKLLRTHGALFPIGVDLLPVGTRDAIAVLLQLGRTELAQALDVASRINCYADFNTTVVDGPWDGQEHAYRCPACGLEGSYRAPSFEGTT